MRTINNQRGSVLIETAFVLPLLLLVMVGIFELGRAYETWQVLTNAAREGARASVMPGADEDVVRGIVEQYMRDGQLTGLDDTTVNVNRDASIVVDDTTVGASEVTVEYPFQFAALRPVARLVVPGTTIKDSLTMHASSVMRNEAQ